MCDLDKLTTQLLELSKQLANASKSFNLTLKTKDISFTCNSQDSDSPVKTTTRIKKKSPSSKKRDFLRRNAFLKKKMEESNNLSTEETNSKSCFPCDVCDFLANSRKDINIHMVKEHKSLEQLDGNTSINSTTVEEKDQDTKEETEPFKLTNRSMVDDWPKGSKPPDKVLHPTKGIGTDPEIIGPDDWNQHMVLYKFKDGKMETLILV